MGAEESVKEGLGNLPDITIEIAAMVSSSGLELWAPVTVVALAMQ